MTRPLRAFSMRRALGGGPELCGLVLALAWTATMHVAPLAHRAAHAAEGELAGGHCHGAVCHDLPRSPGPAIVDGSLPDLGALGLAHGDLVALELPQPFLSAPELGLAALARTNPAADRAAARVAWTPPVRGPPS